MDRIMKKYNNIKRYLTVALLLWLPMLTLTAQNSEGSVLPEDTTNFKKENIFRVGYNTRSKQELTTAVSVVGADAFAKPLITSGEKALAGKAAGLTVLQAYGNEPGVSATNLYIRGLGTFSMSRPYILVDDVERSFDKMDLDEIESVTIFKDGASNTQYGQRGANGTIFVTTKRGIVGKPEISFTSQLGTQQPISLPEFLGAKEYVTFYNKALQNDGLMIPSGSKYNPDAYNGTQNPFLYPDVDWYNEFINKNALQQQYKLTFRGGTEAVRYFMLLGYLNQEGLYKHTESNSGYSTNINYDKYSIRTNLDANVTKALVVSLDLAGRMENRNAPNVSSSDMFSTLSSLVPNAMPVQYNDSMLAGTSQYRNNPLGMISKSGYRQYRTIGVQIRAKALLDMSAVMKGLSGEAVFGYDGNSVYGSKRGAGYATYELQPNGTYSKYGENIPVALDMESVDEKNYVYLMNFYGGLNYNRTFGQHGIGANIRYYQAQTYIRGDNPPYGKQGINGDARYNFDNRYFAGFSFAYDGSDEFAPGHRFGFFPAVSAGWMISNEQFLEDNKTITFLKLRASYGEAGNCKTTGFDRYAYQAHWYGFEASYGGYLFGGTPTWSDGAWEGRTPNPDLTWETTRNFNIGMDVSLWNKLSLTLDGFIHDRDNIIMLMDNSTSGVIGAPSPFANAGEVINKGFDATTTYSDKIGQVGFFVQGNVSFARNEVKQTDELEQLPEYLKATGHSITQLWGMRAIGYYKDQADINNSTPNTLYKVRPGDIKYYDVNGDKVINALDIEAIGSPSLPEWTLGLSAGAEYKGIDFSFLLSGYAGRSVMLSNASVWILQNNGNVTNLAYGAWEAGVREDNATYPRLTTEANKNNYRNSTYWIKNGNFLRLSNVEVGYSFPQKWINKLKMNDLRLYVNGQNLLTFDHLGDYNLDPEVLDAGITGYPMTRAVNVGLKLKF